MECLGYGDPVDSFQILEIQRVTEFHLGRNILAARSSQWRVTVLGKLARRDSRDT